MVSELERVRDDLVKEKEERLASSDLFMGKMAAADELSAKLEEVAAKLQDSEHQRAALVDTNKQMAQKLHKLEQVSGI